MNEQQLSFRVRSFERRSGRLTLGQERAMAELWPAFGLSLADGQIDLDKIFNRHAPCHLEIGFGSGQSLLALAESCPEKNFIGIETHKPGIGALLHGIKLKRLSNIRIYDEDAVDVLTECIAANSLAAVQIFFPDPWPKRRHHGRRLIQENFITKIVDVIQLEGLLHLATDWQHYAAQMLKVLSQEKQLQNLAGVNKFATRSPFRPVITKFEARALREGREVWELQFMKQKLNDALCDSATQKLHINSS